MLSDATDHEIEAMGAAFRNRLANQIVNKLEKPTLNDAMFYKRPWCNKEKIVPVFVSPPFYVVLNEHMSTRRFLVYDEIEDSFAWIGDDPSDAADAWNFADLKRWIVINDSTGDKESYAVNDSNMSESINQALECLGVKID